MFVKMSLSRPIDLFCSFCWKNSARSFFPATATQVFCQSLSSHILCSCLEDFSTTNYICNFWHRKFQLVSTHAICSWDDAFMQKGNCGSPNSLCKCTNSLPTLSTNACIQCKIYLSWSNHLVTSFRLEMNVGGFSKHQNKTSDTHR